MLGNGEMSGLAIGHGNDPIAIALKELDYLRPIIWIVLNNKDERSGGPASRWPKGASLRPISHDLSCVSGCILTVQYRLIPQFIASQSANL